MSLFKGRKQSYKNSISHPFRGDYIRLRQNVKWKKISASLGEIYVVFADLVSKVTKRCGKVGWGESWASFIHSIPFQVCAETDRSEHHFLPHPRPSDHANQSPDQVERRVQDMHQPLHGQHTDHQHLHGTPVVAALSVSLTRLSIAVPANRSPADQSGIHLRVEPLDRVDHQTLPGHTERGRSRTTDRSVA